MTDVFELHPTHPQPRLIQRSVTILQQGGLIIYPTDSGYAFGCKMGNRTALERIRKIRNLSPKHHFTLMCRDLSEISIYARLDNVIFRFLKAHTPGAYTFILEATKEVPRRVQQQKRKTIGIRVPDHPVALALLEALGMPMLSASLLLPEQKYPLSDPQDIHDQLGKGKVDVIIDSGITGMLPTSVVDLTSSVPEVLRKGKGDLSDFLYD